MKILNGFEFYYKLGFHIWSILESFMVFRDKIEKVDEFMTFSIKDFYWKQLQ